MTISWADRQGHITVNGTSLEWATFGPEPTDGPVLVLLHEGLGCVTLWRQFPERLAAATGLPIFAYSRAGYGKSDPATLPRPLDYMTREAVEILPTILNALGAEKIILIGHSDGATIAAEYAGRVADYRIRGLILMAPHFFVEEKSLTEIAKAKEVFEKGDLQMRLGLYHADPAATFRGWNDVWLDPGFRTWDICDVIDYFRVPVLAIQAEDDPYGTIAQIDVIEAQSYAPVETVILPKCGHSPHLEAEAETLHAMTDFIAQLRRIEDAGARPT